MPWLEDQVKNSMIKIAIRVESSNVEVHYCAVALEVKKLII